MIWDGFSELEISILVFLLQYPPPRLTQQQVIDRVVEEEDVEEPDVWFALRELQRKQFVTRFSWCRLFAHKRWLFL